MSRRNWTRAQQRRYREQRREQAARVADRLMGKKKNNPIPDNDDMMDALSYSFSTRFYVSQPRMSSIIYGITGV